MFKCVPFLLCHTTCPTPTGLLGDKMGTYSQAAKPYTPVVFRGDLNPVHGLGQHLQGAVDLYTAGCVHAAYVYT